MNEVYRFQLYDSEDIQKLIKEKDIYKNIIESRNIDQLLEELIALKSNNEDLIEKIINLKGDIHKMNEKYEKQKAEFENKERNLSEQIHTIDSSLIELKHEVSKMMDKIDHLQLKELMTKVNQLIEKQEKNFETNKELEEIKNELLQMKEEIKHKNVSPTNLKVTSSERTSEYRRLQNMLKSQNLLQPTSTELHRKNPTRKPSFFNQFASNRRNQSSLNRNIENITITNNDKKVMQTYGLNKNIITRISPSNLNKVDKTGKEENMKEQFNETKLKEQVNPNNTSEKETTFAIEQNSQQKLNIDENNNGHLVSKVDDQSTEKMTEQKQDTTNKQVKMSIFSIFRKS